MELEQIVEKQTVVEVNGKNIDLSKIGNERVAQVLGTLNKEECYGKNYIDHSDHNDQHYGDYMDDPDYRDPVHIDYYADKHLDHGK